jgi:hypothetical protein
MVNVIESHFCTLPRTWFKRAGRLAVCEVCAELHVLTIGCCEGGCVKSWEKVASRQAGFAKRQADALARLRAQWADEETKRRGG